MVVRIVLSAKSAVARRQSKQELPSSSGGVLDAAVVLRAFLQNLRGSLLFSENRYFVSSDRQRQLILLLAALLASSALIAFTMAFWIIASDLKWTGEFFLTGGLFSHWQVWLCTAAVLLLMSRLLD